MLFLHISESTKENRILTGSYNKSATKKSTTHEGNASKRMITDPPKVSAWKADG